MGCGLTQAGYDGTGARKEQRAVAQAEEETVQIIEDKVYAFSKDNPPCYTAQPGEVLQFNTLDCFSGRLTDETVTMKDMDFSYNITNPAAGPVYVEGAEVGDVLVVDIYDIQVADEGTIATDDHCGPLFEGTDYRTKKIKIEGGMADFNGVRFPINPMIGVIGTAPLRARPPTVSWATTAATWTTSSSPRVRVCISPCAFPARFCRWATCTPPWATPNCAAPASRLPRRSPSA